MNVARFIAFCGKLEYGRSGCIFAYISMTTRARDFKFAGTPVQRLQLAMVALTKKSFSAQYAWFSRGGSHMYMDDGTPHADSKSAEIDSNALSNGLRARQL